MPTSNTPHPVVKDDVRSLKPLHTANSVYYPALDGLRALALAAVFMDHYCAIPLFGLGVSVFFVLSGFLITGILWDTREQAHRVRNFYVRRTLRIFPLYYGVFVVLLLTTPLFHWRWNSAWIFWPLYLGNMILYISGWLPHMVWWKTAYGMLDAGNGFRVFMGHFWSLCVEEQFYLIWPWIVFKASRKVLLQLCWAVIIVSPLLRIAAGLFLPATFMEGNIQFRTLFFQADSLLQGALLALALRAGWRERLRGLGRWIPDLTMLATAIYIYCRIDLHIASLHQPFLRPEHWLTWQFSVADLIGLSLILGALQPASLVYKICHISALRWLGRISYGGYVFHDLPHSFYRNLATQLWPAHPQTMTVLLAMAGTLVLASLSYEFFEKKFLRLKDRWTLLEV